MGRVTTPQSVRDSVSAAAVKTLEGAHASLQEAAAPSPWVLAPLLGPAARHRCQPLEVVRPRRSGKRQGPAQSGAGSEAHVRAG